MLTHTHDPVTMTRPDSVLAGQGTIAMLAAAVGHTRGGLPGLLTAFAPPQHLAAGAALCNSTA